jgi:hypothetical protein
LLGTSSTHCRSKRPNSYPWWHIFAEHVYSLQIACWRYTYAWVCSKRNEVLIEWLLDRRFTSLTFQALLWNSE